MLLCFEIIKVIKGKMMSIENTQGFCAQILHCYMSNFKILLGSEWKFDASPKCMPTSEMNKTGLEASGDQAFWSGRKIPGTSVFCLSWKCHSRQHFGATRLGFV